jgi:hypothetical protein
MTTPIKIGTITIKTVSLLFVLNLAFVCAYANTPSYAATPQTVAVSTGKNAESITITGIVTVIYSGKHGYSVDVQTDKDGIYVASVTMPNLGGADKYQACKIGDKVTFRGRTSSKDGIKEMTVEQIISISSPQTQLLIGSTGFRGIEVGDAISKHGAYTHKTTLRMDGGRLDTYQIADFDNNPAGYFHVDPQNKLLVGDIIVESRKAKTEKGIKIGDTYGDLLKVYPNIEVHGSETDGRTYATANNISYRLSVPNSTYDVDKAAIPADGKITQIVIERVTAETAVTTSKSVKSITISGTVKKFTQGKDGYQADVQTDNDGVYDAMVSSTHLSEPDKFLSCKVGDKVRFKGVLSNLGNAKRLTVSEIISVGDTDTRLWITSSGFRGIYVGDAIEKLGNFVKKTTMKTGEGSFDIYQIKDFENNPAGYFMPDPQNNLVVGDITVETPKAQTEKRIKLGGTFKDLLKIYPDIEVHGSESESRTYATADGLSYRLNVANTKYDLDKAKIPGTAKITEIVINRFARQASVLAAEYAEMKASDPYTCWQASGVLNLHVQPSSDSKVEGKHFAGQTLNILETKLINDQLWVKVTYNPTIKMGYEDRFAEGWFAKSGAPTGWIGGAEMPIIGCK